MKNKVPTKRGRTPKIPTVSPPVALPLSGSDPIDELRIIQDFVAVLRVAIGGLNQDTFEDCDSLCMLASKVEDHLAGVRRLLASDYRRV